MVCLYNKLILLLLLIIYKTYNCFNENNNFLNITNIYKMVYNRNKHYLYLNKSNIIANKNYTLSSNLKYKFIGYKNLNHRILNYSNFTYCNKNIQSRCLNGFCNSNNQCICNKNYTTVAYSEDNTLTEVKPIEEEILKFNNNIFTERNNQNYNIIDQCNYKRKSTKIAFILELFIPVGAGHLYLSNYELGYFKIFLFFICLIFLVCFCKANFKSNSTETTKLIFALNSLMFIPIYLIWHITDVFLIGFSIYKDGNNIDLAGW